MYSFTSINSSLSLSHTNSGKGLSSDTVFSFIVLNSSQSVFISKPSTALRILSETSLTSSTISRPSQIFVFDLDIISIILLSLSVISPISASSFSDKNLAKSSHVEGLASLSTMACINAFVFLFNEGVVPGTLPLPYAKTNDVIITHKHNTRRPVILPLERAMLYCLRI